MGVSGTDTARFFWEKAVFAAVLVVKSALYAFWLSTRQWWIQAPYTSSKNPLDQVHRCGLSFGKCLFHGSLILNLLALNKVVTFDGGL